MKALLAFQTAAFHFIQQEQQANATDASGRNQHRRKKAFCVCTAFIDCIVGFQVFPDKASATADSRLQLSQAIWALTPKLLQQFCRAVATCSPGLLVHDTHLAAALMGRLHKLGFKDHQNVTVASILLNTGLLQAADSLNIHHIAAVCIDKEQSMLAMKLALESGDSSLQAFVVNIVASKGQDKLAWKMLQVFNLPPSLFASLGESRILQHLKWLASTAEVHDSLIDSFLRCQPHMGELLCQALLSEFGAGSLRVRKYCTLLGMSIEGVRGLTTREVMQASQTTPRVPADSLQLPRFVERVLVSTSTQLDKMRFHSTLRSTRYIGFQTFWVPNIPQFAMGSPAAVWTTSDQPGLTTASSSRIGTPSRPPPGLHTPVLPVGTGDHSVQVGSSLAQEAGSCLLTVSPVAPVFVCMLAISTNTHVFLLDLISLSAQVSDDQLNDVILSVLNPAHPQLANPGKAAQQATGADLPPSTHAQDSGHFTVPGIDGNVHSVGVCNSPGTTDGSVFTLPVLGETSSRDAALSQTPPRTTMQSPEAQSSPLVWGDTVWTPTRAETGGISHPPSISWAKQKAHPVTGNGSALVESLRETQGNKSASKWVSKRPEHKRLAVAPVVLAYNMDREIAHWAGCFPNVPALSKANMTGGAVDVASVVSASVQPQLQQASWPSMPELCDLVYGKPTDRSTAMCDWGQRPLPAGAKSFACTQAYALVDMTLKMDMRWGNFKWKRMHPARLRAVSSVKWGHQPTGKGTLALKAQIMGAAYESVASDASVGHTVGVPAPAAAPLGVRPAAPPQIATAGVVGTARPSALQRTHVDACVLSPGDVPQEAAASASSSNSSSGISTPPFMEDFTFASHASQLAEGTSEPLHTTSGMHCTVAVPSAPPSGNSDGACTAAPSAHEPGASLAAGSPGTAAHALEDTKDTHAVHVVGLKGFRGQGVRPKGGGKRRGGGAGAAATTQKASVSDIRHLKAGSYAAALFK